MKLIRQLGLLALILFVSEGAVQLFSLPIPANVLGMVLLFVLLCTGVVKEDATRETAAFSYQNMAFFLVPVACGLLVEAGQLGGSALAFILIALVSTVVVYLVTGRAVLLLQKLPRKGARR